MASGDGKTPQIEELHGDLERLQGELTRRERDAERLQREKGRLQRKSNRLQRENDRLKQQVEDLKRQLDEARRAGRRQAAPFAKDRPQGRGRVPGRKAGAEYGRQGCRRRPARVGYRPERLTDADRSAILTAIPNRLLYFDEQRFDMSPYGATGSLVPVLGPSSPRTFWRPFEGAPTR